MSIKKNKNQLIISIIVGVAIAVISYQVIVKLKIENDNLKKLTQTSQSAPIKKIMYVVAKTDIKKGDKIQADNLTTKQFPIEIEGAVENASKISGLTAIKDIKADSPIVEDYFKASDMDMAQGEPRSGYRALGVGLETLPPFAKEGAKGGRRQAVRGVRSAGRRDQRAARQGLGRGDEGGGKGGKRDRAQRADRFQRRKPYSTGVGAD